MLPEFGNLFNNAKKKCVIKRKQRKEDPMVKKLKKTKRVHSRTKAKRSR